MSNAKPMGEMSRVMNDLSQRNWPTSGITPRQARRCWHKELRASGEYEPVDVETPEAERPKGRPTPRRPRRG
jgi:hypothetical protein